MTEPVTQPTDVDDSALRTLAAHARLYFLIPPSDDEVLGPIVALGLAASTSYVRIAEAFTSNVHGLLSTVALPYAFAHTSSTDRHWQRIHSAQRIRSLLLNAEANESSSDLEARRARQALTRARSEMESFLGSTEGKNALITDSLLFLARLRETESFADACAELLRQGLVLCWGAFEVLARDCFVTLLNRDPAQLHLILANPVARRRFDVAKISLDTLASHGFDLSSRMGQLLADQQDLSDLNSIKAVYEALFPNSDDIRTSLASTQVRLLCCKRNLIVHNRGIIDQTYHGETGCTQSLGERLVVSPQDVEDHLTSAVAAATSILSAVAQA